MARRAGVSPKTVSNVVNGTFPVSPQTRVRVEEALTALDYVPNLSARGLRNGRTGVIALALPVLTTAYSAEMAHHFVVAARERGLSVQLQETAGGPEGERELLSRARAQLVDGLILNPVLLETSAIQRGMSLPLPPVVLIGEVDQPIADHVWIDNVAACRDLTSLLIDQGHRRIAILGAMESESSRLRLRGYSQALIESGLPVEPELRIETSDWTVAGGARAMRAYLAGHALPDAVFCLTDSMAIGALSVLWAEGHRVPDDVSVVGYDDVLDAAYAVPALTTVGFDRRKLVDTALDLLTERIADDTRATSSVIMPYSLVVRSSTAPRR